MLGVIAIILSAILSSTDGDPAPRSQSGAVEPLHTADGMARLLEVAHTEFGDHQIENLSVRGDSAILTHSAADDLGAVQLVGDSTIGVVIHQHVGHGLVYDVSVISDGQLLELDPSRVTASPISCPA